MRAIEQSLVLKDLNTYRLLSLFLQKLYNYSILFKLRLSLLVEFTAIVSFALALQEYPNYVNREVLWQLFTNSMLGTLFIIFGANGFNQILEKKYDKLMKRTYTRPLPGKTLSLNEAVILSLFVSVTGFILLINSVNLLTAVLGAIAFIIYIFLYTPLKRKSLWCTPVGAISGGIPVIMGWSAITNKLEINVILLFMILFLWQFPHFFTLGFIHREDYKNAGFVILPVKDVSGKKTAFFTALSTFALIAVSVFFAYLTVRSKIFLVIVSFVGLLLFFRAIDFYINKTTESAHNLLCISFIYLPAVIVLILCGRI